MSQSEDRLDRIEGLIEQILLTNAQQQRDNAAAIAAQNAAIAKILEIQQSNATAIASHSAILAQVSQRLDQVGQRLDQVGQRLDQVGQRLDQVGQQQQVNTQAIAQVSSQMEENSRHLIQIIDYGMDRMEEMVRRFLNPSNNGNPPLEF